MLWLLLLIVHTRCQPYVRSLLGVDAKDDIPEAGTGAGCRNSAGWGDVGCCTPVAMAHRFAVVGRNPSCFRAVANVVAEVETAVGFGRNWRCMEVVGRGLLEGEEESSALRCNSRLLPC